MGLDINSYLDFHAKALQVRDKRASQIANNLANVNTPQYQARDLDFKQALKSQIDASASSMTKSQPGHIDIGSDLSAQLKYRIPGSTSMDGNTVDKDLEAAAYAKNALDYQASLSFLDGKIKSMMRAFRGE